MRTDLDEAILEAFQVESRRLTYTEIRAKLPEPKPDDKQVRRSLRRLWKDGRVVRLDEYHQWGRHSFYSPLEPLKKHSHPEHAGVRCLGLAEQRLFETLVSNLKSYLVDSVHNWSKEESPERAVEQAVFSFNEVLGIVQEALDPGWVHCQICKAKHPLESC